jgi:hypothetical protein
LVRQGKYHDGHFADDLVAACVKMIQEWNPQPSPTWVTCVPSLRHPDWCRISRNAWLLRWVCRFIWSSQKQTIKARTENDGKQYTTGAQH